MKLSQSLIKQVVKKGDLLNYCPRKVKEVYIDKKYDITSEAMLRGQYFETNTIGGVAHGEAVTDLPRLKNGSRSAHHKRIDDQIFRFDRLKDLHEIEVKPEQTQVKLSAKWPDDENVIIEGTVDLFSGISYVDSESGEIVKVPLAMIDIKLTENLYTTYGDFAWAYPQNMDHLQAYAYTWLFMQNYGKQIPFFYWVFDYKPSEQENQLFLKQINSADIAEFKETTRKVIEEFYFHESLQEWTEKPSAENCSKCPLKTDGSCTKAMEKQTAKIIY